MAQAVYPGSWQVPFIVMWLGFYAVYLVRGGSTYGLGRLARGGVHRAGWIRSTLESERFRTAEERINRWGAPVVAASFVVLGLQTLMNLAAGTTRMPLIRYLPALALGAAARATVYSTIGFIGLEAFLFAYRRAPVVTVVSLIVFVVLIAGTVLIRQRPRSRHAERDEDRGEPSTEERGADQNDGSSRD